jgi:hypothetical protein
MPVSIVALNLAEFTAAVSDIAIISAAFMPLGAVPPLLQATDPRITETQRARTAKPLTFIGLLLC